MRKIHIYIVVVVTLWLTSCSKFIDREPISYPTEENFFQEVKDFEGAIIAIYDELQASDQYSNRFLRLMEIRADNVEDQNSGAAGGVNYEIEAFNDTPSNVNFSQSWLSLYQIVFRANLVLQNIDKISMTEIQRNNIVGQASFLRALAYFNLVRLWGGVPLITKTQTVEEARKNKRNSTAEIYEFIISDLKNAKNLPKQWKDPERGRVTRYAAQALLAKVYLYQKEYVLAQDELMPLVSAINLGKEIGLVPQTETFPDNLKMSKDVLFAVQYLKGGVSESVHQNNRYRNQDGSAVITLPQSLFETNDNRKGLVAPTANGTRPDKFNSERIGNETSGDFPIIRCAEVMLLYAEVLNELSDTPTQQAVEALNAIRKNAGISQKQLTDFPTKEKLREEIYLQRRLELALECDRWFDIVRTGQFSTIYSNVDSYRQVYPIPSVEIENVTDKTNWQNKGY